MPKRSGKKKKFKFVLGALNEIGLLIAAVVKRTIKEQWIRLGMLLISGSVISLLACTSETSVATRCLSKEVAEAVQMVMLAEIKYDPHYAHGYWFDREGLDGSDPLAPPKGPFVPIEEPYLVVEWDYEHEDDPKVTMGWVLRENFEMPRAEPDSRGVIIRSLSEIASLNKVSSEELMARWYRVRAAEVLSNVKKLVGREIMVSRWSSDLQVDADSVRFVVVVKKDAYTSARYTGGGEYKTWCYTVTVLDWKKKELVADRQFFSKRDAPSLKSMGTDYGDKPDWDEIKAWLEGAQVEPDDSPVPKGP